MYSKPQSELHLYYVLQISERIAFVLCSPNLRPRITEDITIQRVAADGISEGAKKSLCYRLLVYHPYPARIEGK